MPPLGWQPGDFIISIAVRRKMTGYALLRFRDLLPLQFFTEIFEKSTSLPVISVQTEPSSFCSLVLLYLCHFATFAQRVELSSSWGSGLWMYPNTVPMRLGPHADELASQDTSFVQFEAQKKALEISAALRDLRQVDIRSLGCRWKHGFQRIFTIKDT